MSATSPASTAELQEYCLRKLGKPVVDVNLADEQMDDMIAESVQLFQEYHFDGTERAFLVEQVAASTLTFASSATGTFIEDETITGGSSNATAIIHERTSGTVLKFKTHTQHKHTHTYENPRKKLPGGAGREGEEAEEE